MAETHRLWEKIRAGEYEVVISNIVRAEIEDCDAVKSEILLNYLDEIRYSFVEVDERTVEIASRIVNLGVLRQKSFDDCQHIAAAIVSNCDAIVSWNFRHIVNHKTMTGIKAVTTLEGYNDLLIYAPPMIIGGEENDS
jgi:predicted nucleic acid-binding protein